MPKLKARKVATPGSQSKVARKNGGKVEKNRSSTGRGRPKRKEKKGTTRKGNYKSKYDENLREEALKAVKTGQLSARDAAKKFGVPRSTLGDHLTSRHKVTIGRPTVLSAEEEDIIVERLLLMASWNFPLTAKDLCHLIKSYLDGLGRTTRFIENLPGPDFVYDFFARHEQLTTRKASLLKRAKAALSVTIVEEFFELYSKVAEDVPPCNIWNMDETNFTDNPGINRDNFLKFFELFLFFLLPFGQFFK